ncbi:MAG TPA: MMPL family transporter, partial [Pseudolabrys sp.]|nr:MMPL family transporter [Pseudolabrys sp.]
MTSLPPSDRDPLKTPRSVKPRNLALGIERIGFFSLSHRTLCALAFIVLSAFAAIGYSRVKVDDSLSQLFRSDTDEFRTYEEVTRRFPSNEFDVLIVIEGDHLLDRPSLEKLRELAIDLQLLDGTRGLISIFSAREPPDTGGQIPPPLFPNPLPQGADYQTLIQRVMSNEIIRGKMLSEDGKLTLMVLALEPSVTGPDGLGPTVDAIRNEIKTNLADSGLKAELSGVPVMQLEIRNAIQRDRLVYNSLGFAVGCLIAIIFFRRPSFMIIAAGPPLVAILLALGALGWLGFSLNIFLNVMTPLIMVISFSDSMQITFAARDRLLAGDDKVTAFRNALLIVGPACVLTHGTAGVSFIALQFSPSDLVRTFGEAGLIAVAVALVAVLMGVPLLGVLLIRNEAG